MKKGFIGFILFILLIFGLLFYKFSFALSIKNPLFMVLLLVMLIGLFGGFLNRDYYGLSAYVVVFTVGTLISVFLIGFVMFLHGPALHASRYSSVFEYVVQDIENYTVTVEDIPLIDRESSDNIAIRKFGELTDFVSQYRVVDSEQIMYSGRPIRVSVLEHAGFWSWNRNRTTPGYILVDMQKQQAELVRTDKPVVYSEKAFFGKNIKRYMRFNYKSKLFLNPTAELNETGEVCWVAPTYDRIVGLYGGILIDGLIVVNAHTGEHEYYKDLNNIPTWIDNVYPSGYIMGLYDYKGKYSNGFINTLMSKTGMTMTTEGYNYIPLEEDNWIYTGVTSVSMADESNIGFLFVNKRTLESHYYSIAGAEEFSAMDAAEGVVQHLGYVATFPLLVNVEGVPTYVLSLKDKNALVKMYAMVEVSDYRNVVVGDTLRAVQSKYLRTIDRVLEGLEDSLGGLSGVVEFRELVVMNGNSYLIIKLEGDEEVYNIPVTEENIELLFVGIGDELKLSRSKD